MASYNIIYSVPSNLVYKYRYIHSEIVTIGDISDNKSCRSLQHQSRIMLSTSQSSSGCDAFYFASLYKVKMQAEGLSLVPNPASLEGM